MLLRRIANRLHFQGYDGEGFQRLYSMGFTDEEARVVDVGPVLSGGVIKFDAATRMIYSGDLDASDVAGTRDGFIVAMSAIGTYKAGGGGAQHY